MLFLLAGGSVYGLRLLAAAVLLLAAAGFAAVLQRAVERGRSGPASIAERTATAGTIGAAALAFYYGPWVPTPGYNWMNLLACLVFASAILVTHRPHRAGSPARPVRGDRPERVLDPLGLDFPAAYELVGRARSAWRDESQELWRPVPTAAGAEPPDR